MPPARPPATRSCHAKCRPHQGATAQSSSRKYEQLAGMAKAERAATVALGAAPGSEPGELHIMLNITFAKPAVPKSGGLALLVCEGEMPSGVWQQVDDVTGGA